MRVAGFEFSPPWWAGFLFVLMLALLLTLGTWQVRRGQAKDAIIAERSAAGKMAPIEFDAALAGAESGRLVKARGEYLAGRQLLLDNQVWKSRPGYRVWTPLQLDDGRLVIVDRGWVPLGKDRSNPPNPAATNGTVEITGFWRDWPKPGLTFAPKPCDEEGWPRAVLFPAYPQVACNYDLPVLDGLFLLSEEAEGGFPRDWQDVGLPPLRHYGYALQWYALALALCVIFIVTNTQKRRD